MFEIVLVSTHCGKGVGYNKSHVNIFFQAYVILKARHISLHIFWHTL